MKRILTIFILLLSALAAFASGRPPFLPSPNAQAEDPISSIRQHYAEINRSVAKYRKVKKELSGFSAEGGQLVAYFDGANLTKIAATFFGETGKTAEEYYYWNSKLIFVLRTEYRYSKPLSGKIVKTEVNRFYLNDDKLIRWIDESGKQVAAETSEYAEKQKDYLDSSKQFSEGARSKKPTIESNQ